MGIINSLTRLLSGDPLPEAPADTVVEEAKAAFLGAGVAALANLFVDTKNTPETQDHPWAYENISWVYLCTQRIAQAISSVELEFFDKAGGQVEKGPLIELFSYVNKGLDSTLLWEWTGANLELQGNALWRLDRGATGSGFPVAIEPLFPDELKWEHGAYWRNTRSGLTNERIDPDDVIHLKQFSPRRNIWGQSTVEALEVAINSDRHAELLNYNLLNNGAMPSGILWVSSTLSEEQRKQMKSSFQNQYGGAKGAGKTMLLDGLGTGSERPEIDYKAIGMTMRDAQFLELRGFSREQILAVFGVPPSVAGIFDNATYANAELGRKQFWSDTILPKLNRIDSLITEELYKFGKEFDGYTARFNTGAVEALQPDRKEQAEVAALMLSNGFSIREMREAVYGDETIQEDHDPLLDRRFISASLRPLEETINQSAETQQGATTGREQAKLLGPVIRIPRRRTDEERKGLWTKQQDVVEKHTQIVGSTVARIWKGFTDEVVAKLRSEEKSFRKATAPPVKTFLFDLDEAGKVVVREMTPELLAAYRAAGNAMVDLFDLPTDFEIGSVAARDWERSTVEKIVTLPKTYHGEIEAMLQQALDGGRSYADMVSELETFYRDQYGAYDKYKANRIAETEVNRANSNAGVDAMQQNGVERIEWVHSYAPTEPRPSHMHGTGVDGMVRKLGEFFPTSPTPLRWPHDENGTGADNIKCRCTVVPAIE